MSENTERVAEGVDGVKEEDVIEVPPEWPAMAGLA